MFPLVLLECFYTVSRKKASPFLCDNLVRCHSVLYTHIPPGNLKQTRVHSSPRLVLYVRIIPCKTSNEFYSWHRDTSGHSTQHCIVPDRRPPNSHNVNPVDYEVRGVMQERVYRTPILTTLLMWSGAWLLHGWSAAACHWRGNRHVARTAARLCENWWATLRTFAVTTWGWEPCKTAGQSLVLLSRNPCSYPRALQKDFLYPRRLLDLALRLLFLVYFRWFSVLTTCACKTKLAGYPPVFRLPHASSCRILYCVDGVLSFFVTCACGM